jgi:hypothetical protein
VFAPALNFAFHIVINLTNPIKIFEHAYQEKGIGQFLANRPWDGMLKPEVQSQLERYAIPAKEFETIMRQEIIAKKTELVVECERCGLAV